MAPTEARNLAAIITGSARGIGKAIAIKLAEDGYDIALNDLPSRLDELETVATKIKEIGRKVLIAPADVTDEQAMDDLVSKTVTELGEVYIASLIPIRTVGGHILIRKHRW